MNAENASVGRRLVLSWGKWFFWPAFLFVVIFFTQSLWLPLLVPIAVQRAQSSRASPSEKRWEWDYVRRRATETKNQDLLKAVATEPTASGEVRGTAWAALAKQQQQANDLAKAGDSYLLALDGLVSDPSLSASGYTLRNEVWNQLRFQLGTAVDAERYRAVLVSWAERTSDQRLLEQLAFELGKMKLLAKAESHGGDVEMKR
jgi:hypothetical protein